MNNSLARTGLPFPAQRRHFRRAPWIESVPSACNHYVDAKLTVSGHVDVYEVTRGAVLKLPLR